MAGYTERNSTTILPSTLAQENRLLSNKAIRPNPLLNMLCSALVVGALSFLPGAIRRAQQRNTEKRKKEVNKKKNKG